MGFDGFLVVFGLFVFFGGCWCCVVVVLMIFGGFWWGFFAAFGVFLVWFLVESGVVVF